MANIQVRLPEDLLSSLDAVASELHASRSEIVRRAVAQGLRAIRADQAVRGFEEGAYSLEGAAEHAGLTLQAMARELSTRGVATMRYQPDEADADLHVVRRQRAGRPREGA